MSLPVDVIHVILHHLDLIAHYPIIRQLNHYFHDLITKTSEYQLLMTIHQQCHCSDNITVDLYVTACQLNSPLAVYLAEPTQYNKICGNLNHHDLYNGLLECCLLGHLTIMKDILAQHFKKINCTRIFQTCCMYNYLEMTRLLYTHYVVRDHNCIELAFRTACCEGHLEMVKLLLELTQDDPINIHVFKEAAFRRACKNGHLPIVQFLMETFPEIDIHKRKDHAFKSACSRGHLEIVEFLIQRGNFDVHSRCGSKYDEYAFMKACQNGHLTVAQYLMRVSHGTINIHANDDLIFSRTAVYMCKSNDTCVLDWLLSMSHQHVFASSNVDVDHRGTLFEHCCRTGNLEMAKYVFELRHRKEFTLIIDIHANKEEAFFLACKYGKGITDCGVSTRCCRNNQLDVVKWLLEISQLLGKPIDIRAMNDLAFRISCKYGHLELAKYLFDLSCNNNNRINIHAENEYAFLESYRRGHREVAHWLLELSFDDKVGRIDFPN